MNNNDKFKEAKGGPLIWFIKDRITPFNAVILACGSVSAAIDFVMQGAPRILLTLASLGLIAALFVLCTLRFPAAGLPSALNAVHNYIRRFSRGELVALCIYLTVGTLVFGGAAYASNKNKGDGGVVAALFPILSDIQRKLGRIDHDNTEMKDTIKKVKLETSTDPRKELANRGVLWNLTNFEETIRGQDIENVSLFLQGKMRYTYRAIAIAEDVKSDEILNMLGQHPDLFTVSECPKFLMYADAKKVLNPSDTITRLIKTLCNNDESRASIKTNAVFYENAVKARVDQFRRMEIWAKSPSKCVDDILHDRGPGVNSMQSLDMELIRRSSTPAGRAELAKERCKEVQDELEQFRPDVSQVEKWKALAKMLS